MPAAASGGTEVVAHRGASAHRAEHTLAAYELAIEQGADGVECDVRLSRDGHLVCVHDRRVDRTSSGRGVVSTLPLAQLAELDYGHWHDELPESADGLVLEPLAVPSSHPHSRGLLTLETLLGLLSDISRPVRLFVETKHPTRYAGLVEAKLVALLARHGLASPSRREESAVVMMSFSSRAVRRIREYAPQIPTVLLLDRLWPARRDGSLPPWADIAGPGVHLLHRDPEYVSRAAERGYDTYCWTVDDVADVNLCRDLGVRYLATNAPAATRSLLTDRVSANVAP
ncbi:putative glycerophosphoryl diester phosphodiesterase [Longimycelium tulufanense]|uniref:Putative glycerophosphoryl diester phosphodiesterase n=1 Tax=Longimycelium tulufanense TaxID=907463 RepID=A0A8J3CHJ0_9PSEU|nr:glycerophosphodiester phosphodiesterase family protein [Longimycelium tulufanense]GGM76212.1 putative glycerophosphoryl diester phosphodiesterase [Longimycelium tulufanense]